MAEDCHGNTLCPLRGRLQEDMKIAMRGKERQRLAAIRLLLAAIKQKEVDDRVEISDAMVQDILVKQLKQRRDSFTQYTEAGREDLAVQEQFECDLIASYLPKAPTEDELQGLVSDAVAELNASSMKDMGKVMGLLKSRIPAGVDMGKVSQWLKAALSA